MTTYLSSQALEEMKSELVKRKKEERRIIAEKIAHAKELGDLSENFEYQTAKDEQALNESRIAELEAKIHDVVLVEDTHGASEIGLGTTFIVEIEGIQKTFSLVGSTEANPLEGKISNESPIGVAFLGRKSGDNIDVNTPSGRMTYKIIEIL